MVVMVVMILVVYSIEAIRLCQKDTRVMVGTPTLGGGHTPKTLFVPSNSLGVGNFQNLHFWAKSALELINT